MTAATIIFAALSGLALIIVACAVAFRLIFGPPEPAETPAKVGKTPEEVEHILQENLNRRLIELQGSRFSGRNVVPLNRPPASRHGDK